MIKATSGDTIILGLSRTNIERLQAGQPISFDGATIGLEGKTFVILFGETEKTIMQELESAVGTVKKTH